ncbi:MAG: hypothetical protein J7601_12215 [Chloroflexi bacterium]|nr:hypothetical protein [Chloroflexota bacterium]
MNYVLKRLREHTAVGICLRSSPSASFRKVVLGERLDKRNFRRRILQAQILEEVSERLSGEGRPAKLYRYRADAVAEVKARRLKLRALACAAPFKPSSRPGW